MSTWGQLAYTSTSGGFGIHAEAGLSAPERDLLVEGAYPGRDSFGQDLPLLADPAQVATFHRNLSYRLHEGVGGCYWHSAPAGADESGRTGNCFIHALLDHDDTVTDRTGGPAARPIEIWRSPSMLAPFGSREVKSATLPALPPVRGAATTRQQVVDFLGSFVVDRVSTLAQLVAAVAAPRRQPLVLGVGSPDEGALWVAGLSYLLAPSAARELSFSVWEAPELLAPDRLPEVEVLCVEESRIPPKLNDLGLLILHSSHPPAATSADDQEVATAFAALASQLYSLAPEETIEVLVDIDAVGAAVPLDGVHRAWPLAMAMAKNVERWPHLRPRITDVLLQTTPATIGQNDELWGVTERLIKQRSASPDRDLANMREDAERASGPLQTMLHQAYVEKAAQDPRWYADPANRRDLTNGRRPGAAAQLMSDPDAAWFVAARAVLAGMGTPDAALHITWLCDFLLHEGWSSPVFTPARAAGPIADGYTARTAAWTEDSTTIDSSAVYRRPEQAIAQNTLPERARADLADLGSHVGEGDRLENDPFNDLREILGNRRMAQRFVDQVGDLSDRTKRLMLVPIVEDVLRDPELERSGPLGDRLSPALIDFLSPSSELASDQATPSVTQPMVAEALAHHLHGPNGAAVGRTLAWTLTRQDVHQADPRVVTELLTMLRDSDLHVQEVARLVDRHGNRVDSHLVLRTLAVASAEDLRELVESLTSTGQVSGLARSLITIAHEPIIFLGRYGDDLQDAGRAGLLALQRAADIAGGNTGSSGPQKLSAAWAPAFDLLVSLSGPDRWLRRRETLFGAEVPVEPSVEFIAHHLAGSGRPNRHRDELHARLLFNAWYAAEWPERVSGSRQRRDAPTPFQRGAERVLRGMHEDDRNFHLDTLSATIERRVQDLPFPAKSADRDIDHYLHSAESWFRRTAGTTTLQQISSRFRFGGKKT